jgi:predicted O-methyltransferase YrrM
VADRGDEWLEPFIAAMHSRGRSQAPMDVNLLDLHDVTRVLDLGGGSGVFAMAFARVKQDLHATVFDLPEVVGLTRQYVADAGLSDRIDTLAGDYRTDDIGDGYDLVFLSAIVHSNSDGRNAELIRKCADALNPGGQVVVQDFVMDEDRVHPAHGAMFALNMLVATPEGDTFTEAEICGWMEAAGLVNITRQDTQTGTAQVIGYKPAV